MSRHVTPSSTPRLSSWKAHIFPARLLLLLLLLLFTLPIDSLSTKNRKPGTLFRISCHHRANVFFVRICCSYMFESGPAGSGGVSLLFKAESNRPCCVRLVWFWSWSPAYLALVGSLTLVRQYRSSSSSSFCCRGERQQERRKIHICSGKYKYK